MIEAVVAILVYADEVFVIKRQPHLRVFPGYYAFPGGKIDHEDGELATPHPLTRNYPDEHIDALRRELAEELNFDLGAALEQGAVLQIKRFGRAVTPDFEPVRFSAHYYLVRLRDKPDLVPDEHEIAESGWYRPGELYAQYQRGQALMVVPMRNTLRALAQDIGATSSPSFNVEVPGGQLPMLELLDGLRTIPVPSKTLPPARCTNSLLLGDTGQRQILVDPSPESESVYLQLLETLSRQPAAAILVTHHHPDHHERAFDLARECNLPVLLTSATLENLGDVYGADYCNGVQLEIVADQEVITQWKHSPLRVYYLPGHDSGMLGLAPDSMAWFFVADLAQSNGSVLIPERGGDMREYMASLRRVIDMNPAVVMPSHGIPSGGLGMLQGTLRHRLAREAQIHPLLRDGAAADEICGIVYPGLEGRLRGYALQTVRQHIRKLQAEAGA